MAMLSQLSLTSFLLPQGVGCLEKGKVLNPKGKTPFTTPYIFLLVLSCFKSLLLRPHGQQPTRLRRPWDFPGKNTGVGCHFLLQGIFPTQESNPGLLLQTDSSPSEPPGKTKELTKGLPFLQKSLPMTRQYQLCSLHRLSFPKKLGKRLQNNYAIYSIKIV